MDWVRRSSRQERWIVLRKDFQDEFRKWKDFLMDSVQSYGNVTGNVTVITGKVILKITSNYLGCWIQLKG